MENFLFTLCGIHNEMKFTKKTFFSVNIIEIINENFFYHKNRHIKKNLRKFTIIC